MEQNVGLLVASLPQQSSPRGQLISPQFGLTSLSLYLFVWSFVVWCGVVMYLVADSEAGDNERDREGENKHSTESTETSCELAQS